MATVAISALPAVVTPTTADVFPVVQGATTKKLSLSIAFSIPPAIGGTTPNTGAFTTLSSTGTASFGTGLANHLALAGSATLNALTITAVGSDGIININLVPKGGGSVVAPAAISSGSIVTGSVGATDATVTGPVQGTSFVVGASGPTITTGSGVPAATVPKGSIYLRTGGGVGTTLYVSQGGGTWNAVAGV